jgi:hypothetical protein
VAAADVVQSDLTALNNDIASGASASTIAQDMQMLNADIATLQSDERVFANDSTDDLGAAGTAGQGQDAISSSDFGGASSAAMMRLSTSDIGNAPGAVKKRGHDAQFDVAVEALRNG